MKQDEKNIDFEVEIKSSVTSSKILNKLNIQAFPNSSNPELRSGLPKVPILSDFVGFSNSLAGFFLANLSDRYVGSDNFPEKS